MELHIKTLTLPSGIKWTIRESTGADDDALSNLTLSPADLINAYLARVSVDPEDSKKRFTKEDIAKLKVRDKYALLIFSRIFSLGETLIFEYDWPTGKQEYEIDLSKYVWEYDTPFPYRDSIQYFDQRIPPYDGPEELTGIFSDGRPYKMDYLDGIGEKYLLDLAENHRTINQQLIARNFSIQDDQGKFHLQKGFDMYSSRELAKVRSLYEREDPPVTGLIHIQDYSGQVVTISLLEVKDFFFPAKI